MREDRIILPIPPSLNWWEALPVLLPETRAGTDAVSKDRPAVSAEPDRRRSPAHGGPRTATAEPQTATAQAKRSLKVTLRVESRFAPEPREEPRSEARAAVGTPGAAARKAQRCDPALIRKARELRDRFLEAVNDSPGALPIGKYDLSRTLETRTASSGRFASAGSNEPAGRIESSGPARSAASTLAA